MRGRGEIALRGALTEAVAIVGLFFYMMTANYQYTLTLTLVSALLLLYTAFPRRGEWERAVAAAVRHESASANVQPGAQMR